MKKAVLISISPKWCALIASGQKTIEVRKTQPKLETPFKCYIYCTKPSKSKQTICGCFVLNSDELFRHPRQGIKYGDSIELMAEDNYTKDNFLNGKVIGEFICDGVKKLYLNSATVRTLSEQSCIPRNEIHVYAQPHVFVYGWHISNLVIYDKPKELNEFYRWNGWYHEQMERPPQSWMYVEDL